VAVSVVVNYEEGAERSITLGDAFDDLPPGWLRSVPPAGTRDRERESFVEYGSRVGIWRLLRILDRHGVPATIFACAQAFDHNPAAARACVAAGHEIASHGERWEPHSSLDPAEEKARMERSRAALHRHGAAVSGWYSRDGLRSGSRRSLRDTGYSYDSNTFADDLPWLVDIDGRQHPVVPYTGDVNDYRLLVDPALATSADFAAYLLDSLEQLLAEADEQPAVLSVGLHAPLAGRPAYAPGLSQFLEAAAQRDVWFARRAEIAAWWLQENERSSTK